MEILKRICREADKKGVGFLVIGGHAINAYGYSRQTGDLDLISTKASKGFWTSFLNEIGYKTIQDHEVFGRFQAPTLTVWPIDLMYVDDSVFEQLSHAANEFDFGQVRARVPSITHLIALKLHALKQRQEHRESKDIMDVRELHKRSDLKESELLSLLKSRKDSPDNGDAVGNAFLDLPDAPDFVSTPPDIPVADNIKLCEEMLHIWNANPDPSKLANSPYIVPFKLLSDSE